MAEIYSSGIAKIRHKETGVVHDVDGADVDWDSEGTGEERGMGDEIEHRGTIDHDELGELVWILTEYPVGAENYRTHDLNDHELVEDFDWGLEHHPED